MSNSDSFSVIRWSATKYAAIMRKAMEKGNDEQMRFLEENGLTGKRARDYREPDLNKIIITS